MSQYFDVTVETIMIRVYRVEALDEDDAEDVYRERNIS